MTLRSSWLAGCAAIAAAALLLGVTVAFHGPMTFRPVGVRVQMGDAMRPLAFAAIADLALFALAFRRSTWRRVAFLLAVAIVAVAVLAAARRAAPAYPVSDRALIELATINALDGRQLYGPYSRYGWQHPGPLLFYLLAPFYAASGSRTAGLAAGALVINLAALAAAVWVLLRHADPSLAVGFTALFALYVAHVPGLVVSSWNAHAAICASAAVVVISAAVAAGHIRLLPLFLAVASFVLQTHVATFPLVAVAAVLVLAAIGRRWIGASAEERAVLRAQANRAAWVLAALWLLPLVEELQPACRQLERDVAVRPSAAARRNVASGARRVGERVDWRLPPGPAAPAGAAHRSQHGCVAANHRGSAAVAPGWCRCVGGPARTACPRVDGRGVAGGERGCAVGGHADPGWDPRPRSVLDLRGRRRGRRFDRGGRGGSRRFRMEAAGSLLGPARVAGLSAALLMIGVSLEGLRQITSTAGPSRSKAADDHVVRVTQAIQSEIERQGSRRPLVVIDQRVWDWAAGAILQLRKQGTRVVIDGGLVAMFAGTLAPDGSEDLEISFCGGPCHERLISRPGNIVVLLTDAIAIDARPLHR